MTVFWRLSPEDCTREEDRRETAKRKTKKEDAGLTYGTRGKEDQLRGIEERSTKPGRMASSSLEPALGQSTQRRRSLISHRYWDTATYWPKIANFAYTLSFSALVRGDPLRIYEKALLFLKLESARQPMVKIWWFYLAPFWTDPPVWRTDRRNCDGQKALKA